VTKVLVESRQGSNLLYLPLDKLMQATAQGGAAKIGVEPAAGSAALPPVAPSTSTLDTRARDTSRTRDRETR